MRLNIQEILNSKLSMISLGSRVLNKVGYLYRAYRNRVLLGWSRVFGLPYLRRRADLVILDDVFPSILTQFRVLEFGKYLGKWHTEIFSTVPSFKKLRDEYAQYYPGHTDRIHPFRGLAVRARAAYFVFVNNGALFINFIEKNKLPFAFTLYPGGGFAMDNETSDKKLKRLFGSPFFRYVLVTQNITRDYLLSRNLCPEERIVRVAGSPYKQEDTLPRRDDGRVTFDLVFCAAKYMEKGMDKGYDLFIETMRLLRPLIPNLRVHVVGPFDRRDVDVGGLEESITFHGVLPIDRLREVYTQSDIILSPNRAGLLGKGFFDGFPTGAVVVAGLEGVAMFVTDELGQNEFFTEDKEIVVIDHDPGHIAQKVMFYFEHPALLDGLKHEGQQRLRWLTGDQVQMTPRYEILESLMREAE